MVNLHNFFGQLQLHVLRGAAHVTDRFWGYVDVEYDDDDIPDDDRVDQGDHVQAGHEVLPTQFQREYLRLDGQCGQIATADRTYR